MGLVRYKLNRFQGSDGLQRLKEVSCEDLDQYILEKTKAIKLKLSGLDLDELKSSTDLHQYLEDFTTEKLNQGIHFSCLKPDYQLSVLCEALVMSGGIASIAKAMSKKSGLRTVALASDDAFIRAIKKSTPTRFRNKLPTDVTYPSRSPNLSQTYEGHNGNRFKNNRQINAALDNELEVADLLAKNGFRTRFRKHEGGKSSSPDLDLEGRVFDIYSPASSTTVERIIKHTLGKVRSGQTDRVVLDIRSLGIKPQDLRMEFVTSRPDLQGLKEVLGVSKDGKVIQIFP